MALYEAEELDIAVKYSCRPLFKHKYCNYLGFFLRQLSFAYSSLSREGLSLALYEAEEQDLALKYSCRPLFKHKYCNYLGFFSPATILRPGEGISLALYEAYEQDIAMVHSCRPLFKHKLQGG